MSSQKTTYRVSVSRVYTADVLISATSAEDAYEQAWNNLDENDLAKAMLVDGEWDSQDVVVHDNSSPFEQRLVDRLKKR